ncbi:zinc finger protein 181-like [Palaemon carinicauda]|uniref:zinc finger protein 181-like n=1 Tax=Palaemon carinicauda TaxID=392227 RepID=UPI0035B6704A
MLAMTATVKQESSAMESLWNSTEQHTKNVMPLLVLHELAAHDNRVTDSESDVKYDDVTVESDVSDHDFDDHFEETEVTDEDEKDPLFVHDEESFDNTFSTLDDDGGKSSYDTQEKNANSLYDECPILTKKPHSRKKTSKRKSSSNFCDQNIKRSRLKNNCEQSEKDADFEPVRKSKRKVKKNVIFFDSFVTYTSEMFESDNGSLVKEKSLVCNDSINKMTTKSKTGTMSEKKHKIVKTKLGQNFRREKGNSNNEANAKSKTTAKKQRQKSKLKRNSNTNKKLRNNNYAASVSHGKNVLGKRRKGIKTVGSSPLEQTGKNTTIPYINGGNETKPEIPLMQLPESFGTIKEEADWEPKPTGPSVTYKGQRKYRLKTYFCEYCPESFSTSYYLKLHIMHHTNEKPYRCDICNKAFRMRWRVKVHRVIHDKVKPFSCKLCGHRTCRKDNLTSHLKRLHKVPVVDIDKYTGDCPTKQEKEEKEKFCCNICDSKYSRRDNLSNHVRNKHNMSLDDDDASLLDNHPRKISSRQRPYSCTMCPRFFTKKENGLAHMKLCHHMVPPEVDSYLLYDQGSEKD